MSKLILDATTRDKLFQSGPEAELYDESGQKIGHFLSPDAYLKVYYNAARLAVTDQELESARRESGGWTTAEVLAHLENIRQTMEPRP